MEIRFARQEDVPQILTLLRQVGLVHHRGRPDLFRSNAQKYSASQVMALLESPSTPIFVAVEGNTLLGYGFCVLKICANDPVMEDHTTLYLDDLCVAESCRRQGVGKQLYDAICSYAKAQNCSSLTLNVWCCNESAMKFYEKCGMKPQKIGMETSLEDR